MPNRDRPSTITQFSTNYQIRVQGHLGSQWQVWFDSLTITTQPTGDTLISGPMTDQAALYGILKKVRNLGLPLISVNPIASIQTPMP